MSVREGFSPGSITDIVCQYSLVVIVCVRSRVKVLDTGSPDGLLFMKNQLLNHPVIIRLSNVCFPMFLISHNLSG